MSHMPLCEAPSVPVTPARSSTNVTPHLCRATSIRTWSKAPVEEGRVHGEDGMQSAGRQARRGHGAVLLRDADVVHPFGEDLGELVEADRLEGIAAVMATTSLRSWPSLTISSPKTEVQSAPEEAIGRPVSGWILPTAWKRSASSCRAGWCAAALSG